MPDAAVDRPPQEPGRVDVAWFVNKPVEVTPEDVPAYMEQGVWASPNPDAHRSTIAQVRPGDRIACKSVSNQSKGLPFFSADRLASVMTIYGTGTVLSVDADAARLDVDWRAYDEPRKWYFWTAMRPIWRVDEAGWRGRQLLNVAFADGKQDIDAFLGEPYWKDRYARMPEFTWIPFYQEFATRLLDYQDNREELSAIVVRLAESERFLRTFSTDRYPGGTSGPISDIDPFTVMATFNRQIRDGNRLRVAQALGDALGVRAPLPDDFEGVPVMNNQNSWFIRFAEDRQPDDIDNLWRIFTTALRFAEDDSAGARAEFVQTFDDAQQVSGVWWNLSQGLYWARPNSFPTLEGQSRPFIRDHFDVDVAPGGEAYVAIVNALTEKFNSGRTSITSFPLLSYAAWTVGASTVTPYTVAGFARWAIQMDESYDLEEQEHNHKRQAAETLRQARDQMRAGDPSWPTTFSEGLKRSGALLHFMFKDDVSKAVEADPDDWAGLLDEVWADPDPESLDSLLEGLRARLPRAYPGSVTSLGALLLMAADTENNAPYLTSRTERWYRLTDRPGPADGSSPADRYRTFLNFLDELRGAISDQVERPVSRLEAQGMAFAVTEEAPHPEWDKATTEALLRFREAESTPPRAWLVRSLQVPVQDWLDNHVVSLRAEYLGHVSPGATLKDIRDEVEAGYPQEEYPERQALTAAFHAFLSRMRPEDSVVALDGQHLHIGRISSEARYINDDGKNTMQREVEWLTSVPTDNLPTRIQGFRNQPGAVVEVTEASTELDTLLQVPTISEDTPEVTAAVEPTVSFPVITDAVADDLHTPVSYLQEISDLLEARRQIILYGPPGTGKTFLALTLAQHLAGHEHPEHAQLVQFHPSYAYEDFFEGFRPEKTESGHVSFEIKPGPLRRIAQEARKAPGTPFFLIIDELNRANLAKVFGELYFLLEYRNQSVQLQYSNQPFELPKNLYFIGTMNTADRSVALLDAAMRRRFAFVELHPDEPPVDQVLEEYLNRKGRGVGDDRAGLLARLNAAIDESDRDFKIGPSYLMRPEAETEEGLERIWRFDILPLLEEHYYGRMSRSQITDRYGLAALRNPTGGPGTIEDPLADDRP